MLAVNKKKTKIITKSFSVRTNESSTGEVGKETKTYKNDLNPTDYVSTGMNRASKFEWLVF